MCFSKERSIKSRSFSVENIGLKPRYLSVLIVGRQNVIDEMSRV